MKRWRIGVLSVALAMGLAGAGEAAESVMLYASLKETQLQALKEGFTKLHPSIKMEYFTAGTGKIMSKLAAEQQAGRVVADVLWVGEPHYLFTFKEQGRLLPYPSPEAKGLAAHLKDADGAFTAGRVITLGLGYHAPSFPAGEEPKDWTDLHQPRFKGQVGIADPTLSGTAFYTVATIVENYGWGYFEKLKANGAVVVKGAQDIVDRIASGDLKAGIVVDYIAKGAEKKGSPIRFIYPKTGLIAITSPLAILKSTQNPEAAKKLVDFVLSTEGQAILAKAQVLPVRSDGLKQAGAAPWMVEALFLLNLPRVLPVSNAKLHTESKALLERFTAVMRSK
jgi:iron(III) transport system substrate-binding protein